MKKIKLTQGKFAIVDNGDFESLNKCKWYYVKTHGLEYALGNNPSTLMHRVIIDAKKGEVTDHINGNGLDNRRKNLRICTIQENTRNQRLSIKSTSGVKGVTYHIKAKKWQAQITVNEKVTYLGIFKKKSQAKNAYNKAAKKFFGEFARLNY